MQLLTNKWVKIIHRYFQVINVIHEMKINPTNEDRQKISEAILKLSKIKIKLKRLKYSIQKSLCWFEAFLDLIIVLFRWMIGKAKQSIWEFTLNKVSAKTHELKILKTEFFELFINEELIVENMLQFLDKYFYYFI